MSADLKISLDSVQRQLDKFERSGALVSKLAGRTRLYTWNKKSPLASRLKGLVEVVYEGMSLKKRVVLFATRIRPRAKGKSV